MSTVEQDLDPELEPGIKPDLVSGTDRDRPWGSRHPVAPLSDERLEHIRIFAELATRGMAPPVVDATVADLDARRDGRPAPRPAARPAPRPAPARVAGGARRRTPGAPQRPQARPLGGPRVG